MVRAGLSPLYGSVQASGAINSWTNSSTNDTPALDHQEGSGAGLDQDSSLETLKKNKLEDRYVEWTHKF